MHTSLKNKITLVTGVSSGIGREIAQLLAERGARVFGTVRNVRSASSIHGVELVSMDVTEDASVNAAVQSIVQKAGPIQFLVNNAGYSFMGALEETSVAEARQQFETNLFGVLRVTNAILPGMRQQGFGRIVNISSVLGFLPAPYMGVYAASKHAVEGYTETLDHEIRRFGVRALLVEPAYTKTKIKGNSKFAKGALEVYADERKRLTDAVQQNIEHGDDPRIVAEAGDVESSLAGIHFLPDQAAAQDRAVANSRRAAELASERYRAGIVSYLEVVDADRVALQSERGSAQLAGQRLIASVHLIKALGGGWQGRD